MQDDADEELHVGAERRIPRRLQRPGMVVLVAVVGLGGAVLVGRLNDGSGTSPSSTASASGSTPGPATPVISRAGGFPLPSAPSIVVCPVGANCRTAVDRLPAGTVAALREYYPGAVVRASSTLTRTNSVRTVLLRRSITAVAGGRRLEIVVTPFVLGPDDFDRQNSATISRVSVKSSVPGQTVQLTLTEPRTARPNDLVVLRLARDPRLAALS